MDVDEQKHELGIIINNLAHAAQGCITAGLKLSQVNMDDHEIEYLEQTARKLEELERHYRTVRGELPADDRQS